MAGKCLDADIKIVPAAGRIKVFYKDTQIADSHSALELREGNLPVRLYIPRTDVDQTVLVQSDHTTHCPYKGDAAYHHVKTDKGQGTNAVWYYPEPCLLVDKVRDHLSFWGDDMRVETA